MRSRTSAAVRVVRYTLLALCLLFAGGIAFLAISDHSQVEADPLSDYRPREIAR